MAEQTSDVFGQHYPMTVRLDGVDTSTVVTTQYNPNLGARGRHGWIVHGVEWFCEGMSMGAITIIRGCICVIGNLAAVPDIGDVGVISRWSRIMLMTTSGAVVLDQPTFIPFARAKVIAPPRIHIYAHSSVDAGALRPAGVGYDVTAQMIYTTVPMSPSVAVEVKETWENAN